MKMEITEKKENVILKRTEVRFVIDHAGESTPSKGAVVDEIAKLTKAKRAFTTLLIDRFPSRAVIK